MSPGSRPLHRRWFVIAACFLSTVLAACAADAPTAPRPRPVLDGTDTTTSPCDSSSTTRCFPTQGWG
jgi:hypothetical protein